MRLLPALPILAGCVSNPAVEHLAAYRGSYSVVVVGADDRDLHLQTPAGVLTRQDALTGEVFDRFDPLPRGPERLHDVLEAGGEARVLASGPDAFFDWQGDRVAEPLPAGADAQGVIGARALDWGVAVLRDDEDAGCGVDWIRGGDVDTVPLPPAACDPSACVQGDRSGDRLLVVTADAGWSVTPTDAIDFLPVGGACAWDATAGTLVTARPGDPLVSARDADGLELWATDLARPVTALSDLGTAGLIAVTLDKGAAGQLLLLDSATGDPVSAVELPRPAEGLAGGGDAGLLALWRTDELHVLRVEGRRRLQ